MKRLSWWQWAGGMSAIALVGFVSEAIAQTNPAAPATSTQTAALAPANAQPLQLMSTQAADLAPVDADATTTPNLTIPARAGAGYSTSGGGYDGFGSFEGFMPLQQTPGQNLLYFVGRLLLDNDANLGGNLLLGYRVYNPGANRIYGAYLGYDTRDTGDNLFSQLGLGFETLGNGWDARLNAYIPIGDSRQIQSERVFDTDTQLNSFRFEDHFLRASGVRQRQVIQDIEVAVAGFDTEAGGRLLQFGNSGDLRGYAGLYFLSAGENSFGVRGRLEARPTDFITLGLAVQHDGIFGTNVFGTIALTFPGSRPRGTKPTSVQARLGEMPSRMNTIAIDHQREVESTSSPFTDTILTNPATGQPYFFQHVTLGANGGNGTFETPFGLVQPALSATRADGNDIVYVQAGTNPGIPAFTIPDRVQVLSTGPVQLVPATISGQFISSYQLPLSGSGVFPSVTGTVTMGNDTVLSGFSITSDTGAGVTFNNVSRVQVRDNFITNTADSGILGNGVGDATIVRNQITAARNQGVFLQNAGTVVIADNTITNTIAGTTPDSGQGIAIANFAGQIDLNITNNQIRTNFNDGVLIGLAGRPSGTTTAATASITLDGNTIENNGGATPVRGDGIAIGLEQDAVVNNLRIENNTIQNNGDEGIDIRLGLQAIPITNPTTAQLTGTIQNNTIANNGQNGIQVQARGSTTARVAIDNNTINTNGLQAIDLSTASVLLLGTPDLSVNVRQNTLTRGANPLVFQAQTTPSPGVSQTLCLNLTGNTFASSSRVVLDNVANVPAHTFSLVGTPMQVFNSNTFPPPANISSPTGFNFIANVPACP